MTVFSLAMFLPFSASADVVADFKDKFPSVGVEAQKSSYIPGYTQLDLKGGKQAHISPDGYFFVGDVFKLSADAGVVNLSESTRKDERVVLLQSDRADDPVVFAAIGEKKSVITVFTDVDCAYCRKFHNEVPELQNAGIEVRYLAYPRAGVSSGTGTKMRSVWCNADQNQTMTLAKQGAVPDMIDCPTPAIRKHYELGKRIGVSGTPTIVLDDGSVIPGYRPAAQLIRLLGTKS